MNRLIVRPNEMNAVLTMTDANGVTVQPEEIAFDELKLFDNGVTTRATGFITLKSDAPVRLNARYSVTYVYDTIEDVRDFKLVGCKITEIQPLENGRLGCAFTVDVGQFRGKWNLHRDKEPNNNG